MIAIQRRAVVDEYRQFSFQRRSVAFGSNGRLYYPHQARFETVSGRTGVLVEEGTTNLLGTKGEFEVDSDSNGIADGWSLFISKDLGGLVQHELSSSEKWQGAKSQRIFWSGTFENTTDADRIHLFTDVTGLNENTTYTFSVWLKSPVQSGVMAALNIREGGGWTVITSKDISITDEWQRFEVTVTTPAGITSLRLDITVQVTTGGGQTDLDLYIDGAQLEAKNYATSWITTTRAAETLAVPTAGVLYPQEGTFESWIYIPSASFGRAAVVLDVRDSTDLNRLYFEVDADKKPTAAINKNATRYVAKGPNPLSPGWHFVAMSWSSTRLACYADGALVAQYTSPPLLDNIATAVLGSITTSAYHFNSLIGAVCISRRARTDQEIADAYAAGTLTADADTTLLLPFTGPDAQRGARTLYVPAVGF